jgi:hypothetical protein
MKQKIIFFMLFAALQLYASWAQAQTDMTDISYANRYAMSGDGQTGGNDPDYDGGWWNITGDVNGDESVDISDIVAIINAISTNDKTNKRADVNKDENIDISDIVKVINIIAGTDPGDSNQDGGYNAIRLQLSNSISQIILLEDEPSAYFFDGSLIVKSKKQETSVSLSEGDVVKVTFVKTPLK